MSRARHGATSNSHLVLSPANSHWQPCNVRIVFLLVVPGWRVFYLLEREGNVCYIHYSTTGKPLLANHAIGDFAVCWSGHWSHIVLP
jgi:hypothetical protein